MPPALLVELGCKSRRHPRRFAVVCGIAGRAGCASRAARTGVRIFPRFVLMGLTDPAAVLAEGAFHWSHQMERKRELRSIGSMPKNEVLQMRRHLAQL